jgi:hypothetical protein
MNATKEDFGPIKPECILQDVGLMKSLRECDKVQMMEDLGLRGKIDFALPQPWFNAAVDLGIDPKDYVWSYDNAGPMGKPFNLVQAWLIKFGPQIANRIYVLKNS